MFCGSIRARCDFRRQTEIGVKKGSRDGRHGDAESTTETKVWRDNGTKKGKDIAKSLGENVYWLLLQNLGEQRY